LDFQLHRIAQACDQRKLDVRGAFRAFDTNGDGFVSPQEFKNAVAQLGLGLSGDEADALLAHLDTDNDGMVSYEEFLTQLFRAARDPSLARLGPAFVEHFAAYDEGACALWQRIARAFRDRGVPLRQVFELFDADRDGVISRQELSEAFQLMRLGLSGSDVDRLLRDIDVNQDGRVNIHEFINRLQV
jgi:calmodulin